MCSPNILRALSVLPVPTTQHVRARLKNPSVARRRRWRSRKRSYDVRTGRPVLILILLAKGDSLPYPGKELQPQWKEVKCTNFFYKDQSDFYKSLRIISLMWSLILT